MKSLPGFICSVILIIALCLLTPPPSFSADGIRSCTVKEVLKGGMYVYLRCQEKGKDVWLATVAREFKIDEAVSFLDVPPMTNFYSKYLNRTFPELILMEQLPPVSNKK